MHSYKFISYNYIDNEEDKDVNLLLEKVLPACAFSDPPSENDYRWLLSKFM
jgi:hypothetical protein